MVWPVIAAIGGAIATGMFSSRSASKANKSNEKIVEKTNAQNLQATRETNAQSKKMWRKNREWELLDEKEQFTRLRENAAAAGFNPLSVMGVNQGPATVGMPSLVTPQFEAAVHRAADYSGAGALLAEGLTGLADELTGQSAADRAEQSARTQLMNVQTDQIRAKIRTGELQHKPGLTRVGARADDPSLIPPGYEQQQWLHGAGRPKGRPKMDSVADIPVFKPDGNPGTVPGRLAKRLKIEPWDYVMAEDYEAIGGEQLGQALLLPRLAGAAAQLEGDDVRNQWNHVWAKRMPTYQMLKEHTPPPKPEMRNPDPEAGWMNTFFGS